MQIEVNMTYENYVEASRLWQLHTTRGRRISFIFVWYIYPILGLVFVVLAYLTWMSDRSLSGSLLFDLGASFFLLWCRFSAPRRFRKMYSQQAKDFAGVMTLSATGMRFERVNGTATSDYTWTAFSSWMERPSMFLVFPTPLSFIRIPKDKLSVAEQDEVRGWIASSAKRVG